MDESVALDIAFEAIRATLLVSAPIMIVGLVVGLIIAVFQALTQIQEATLTFVPRILVVFASLLVLLPFMLSVLTDLMNYVMDKAISLG
ncbi:flagellar biosynthetic protein FliQ [Hwanghaeella grinnelliae]|uniref:Flagellar biosynthetic protein FliQ n=1 Tax=Hwanghaeella grinnelliae TaxID=2500179 RepID=A0A437QJF6_9PROT|nr:flagellar biosynthesis protein FliQ [Hwanghaeella grinnelliae]RVU34637.1 flagellar biosynthetic protein FliQ [Hwanghaeella grinnelliae]